MRINVFVKTEDLLAEMEAQNSVMSRNERGGLCVIISDNVPTLYAPAVPDYCNNARLYYSYSDFLL